MTIRAPSRASPCAIAFPIPCDPPVTIATLPSSAPISASGENGVGTRIRFTCVWISGWIFPRKATQRSSAWSRSRRCSRSAWLS